MTSVRLLLRAAAAAGLVALLALHPAVFQPAAAAAAAPQSSGLDLASLDTTCKACDDFWRYGTGGWRKHHSIPRGQSTYDTFDEINNGNRTALRTILEQAAADTSAPPDSDAGKIGHFYAACSDLTAIQTHGLVAVQPELDRINAADTVPRIVAEMARLDRLGVDVGLGFNSESDTRDSSRTIANVANGGLGMPDRDYYLTATNAATRAAYVAYLTKQLGYAGEEPGGAARHAAAIVALETVFAKATPPNADLRDPLATYHPMSVSKLETLAPHIPWRAFFTALDQPHLSALDVTLPVFTATVDAQLARVPADTWQAYMRSHYLTAYTVALPVEFRDASFAFFSTTINGIKQQQPRWKRCVSATDSALRDPLGKVYVAGNFDAAAKTRAKALVDNIQATLHDDISTLPWMSPATRVEAEVKLAAYKKKIGYPDRWVDYSAVSFAPDATFLDDMQTTTAFKTARDRARIGKPTDRSLWDMSPPTVNAYYDPSNNEIVFPAGILQAPLFDSNDDDALIYGAIGAIMGHEMTHGFDDTGRRFDAKGNLRDWWTPADATRFDARAQCIVDQFSGYVVAGVHENGRLDQGEAIADLGGATIAFRAFQRTAQYRAHVKIDGYTPEQRFFLSYAQAWRGLITPQAARNYVLIDPHPDNQWRLVGTVGNMPEFQSAFACAANAKMVRKNRCQIW